MKLSALFKGGKPKKPGVSDTAFAANVYDGIASTPIKVQNGLDLQNDGGMVIIKKRNTTTNGSPKFIWTDHGAMKSMVADNTPAMVSDNPLASFDTDGFTVSSSNTFTNGANTSYSAYSFKNADNFFLTKTRVHTAGTEDTIDFSSLGTIGMVLVVNTSVAQNRMVWHKNLSSGMLISWEGKNPQATNALFTVSGTNVVLNSSATSGTYQISAWADHTGMDNVNGVPPTIAMGVYMGNGSTTIPRELNLGWEPQFILIKSLTSASGWVALDTARSIVSYSLSNTSIEYLGQNTTEAMTACDGVHPKGIRFIGTSMDTNSNSVSYIYMAIRRPVLKPTAASDIFNTYLYTGTNTNNRFLGTGIRPDWILMRRRDVAGSGYGGYLSALRQWGTYFIRTGVQQFVLSTSATGLDQQLLSSEWASPMSDKGIYVGNAQGTTATTSVNVNANTTTNNHHILAFSRRPGFFETVVYKGNGTHPQAISHGLGVAPQLMIVHDVDSPGNIVYYSSIYGPAYVGFLDTGSNLMTGSDWADTWPTNDTFYVGNNTTNKSGNKYQALLFSSCPGVSYIGYYTGTGSAVSVTVPTFTTGVRAVILFGISGSTRWPIFTTTMGNTGVWMTATSPGEFTSSTSTVLSGNTFTVPVESNAVTSGYTYGYLAIAN